MNYILEIRAFYDWLEMNPMSSSAVCLWHALMYMANKTGWATEFTVPISVLQLRTGCKKDVIYTARNTLAQAGLINYRSRGGNQSALYQIIPIVSAYQIQKPTQEPTQPPTQPPTQQPTQKPTQEPTINKLNKTKQNNKKKDSKEKESAKVKHRHGEYKKVSLTDDDFAKLKDLFPGTWEDWVRKLDEYKEQTGKTYANDFLTIKNWHRRDAEKAKEVSKPFVYDRDCGGESL